MSLRVTKCNFDAGQVLHLLLVKQMLCKPECAVRQRPTNVEEKCDQNWTKAENKLKDNQREEKRVITRSSVREQKRNWTMRKSWTLSLWHFKMARRKMVWHFCHLYRRPSMLELFDVILKSALRARVTYIGTGTCTASTTAVVKHLKVGDSLGAKTQCLVVFKFCERSDLFSSIYWDHQLK